MVGLGIGGLGLGLGPRGGGGGAPALTHSSDMFAMNLTGYNYYTPQLFYANIAKYGRWLRPSAAFAEETNPTYINAAGDLIAMRSGETYTIYTPRTGSASTQRFKATWTGPGLVSFVGSEAGSRTIISNVANELIFTVTYSSDAVTQCASLTFANTASANPVVGLDIREVDGSNVPLYPELHHPTGYNRNTRYNGLRFLDTNGFVNTANEFRTIDWADRTLPSNRFPQHTNTQATLTLGSGNAALNFTANGGYHSGYGYKADSIASFGHTIGANGNNISITINAASGAGSVTVTLNGSSVDIVVVPAAAGTTATAVAAQITADTIAGPLVSVTAGGTGAGAVATAAQTYLAGGVNSLNPTGMPLEDRVSFCNAANCDLWMPLGANVTSDYVTNALAYIRDNLNSNLRLFLGMSNEVWNSASPYFNGQIAFAAIARQQGLISTLGSSAPNTITATRRGYAYKYNEVMTIAESVFASQRTRLVRCGEYVQHVAGSTTHIDAMLKPSGAGSDAASYIGDHVDMMCSAPYYGIKSGSTTVVSFTNRNAWATATAYAVGNQFYSLTTNKVYICIVAHTSTGADPSTDEAAGKSIEMTAANLDPYVQACIFDYSVATMETLSARVALYTNDLGVQIKYGCYEASQQFYVASDAPGDSLVTAYAEALYKSDYFKLWDGILYDQFRRVPNASSMWTTNNINGPFRQGAGFGVEEFPWSIDAGSPRRIAFENSDAAIFPPYYDTAPSLSGTRSEGSVLTLALGTAYNITTATLQWLRNGVDLGSPVDVTGLSSSTYTQVAGDETFVIEARVTVTNAGYGSIVYTTTGSAATITDTTPTAFSFVDQSGVAYSSTITSAAIVVAGINAATPISITGGTYSINGGAYTASAGTVVNGDSITVRHTSSASASTATNTVLTIGGVSDTFTSTTFAGRTYLLPTTSTFITNGTLTYVASGILKETM